MKLFLTYIFLIVVPTLIIATGGFIEQCNIATIQFVDFFNQTDPDDDYYGTYTPFLSAVCKSSHGKYVNSTLDLNECIENLNATLVWKKDGEFDHSCGGCQLELPNLCCGCGYANGGSVAFPDGPCIDLDEAIYNDHGQLACDLPVTTTTAGTSRRKRT